MKRKKARACNRHGERTDREGESVKETLIQTLKKYKESMVPMHMPGHKRNTLLSGTGGYLETLCAECDITEIDGFDNLAEPEGILLLLKKRLAGLWKSEEAYPLVNGSTCGVLAGIYGTVPYGGRVVMARNCHKSVYNGVQLVNADCVFLQQEQDPYTGIYGSVTPEAVEAALEQGKNADLVIVTSPTYEGIISDVEGICRVAHRYGVPVFVDSAHGAHLGFGNFPKGATECGADLVVHSLHKTLPCLTQTAVLHRNGTLVSKEEIQTAVNVFQSSSPSYLLLASIDGCVKLSEDKGSELAFAWERRLALFYEKVKGLKYLSVETGDSPLYFQRDPGKLILCTTGTDLTGTMLMDRLRKEYRIEAEMAAERYVIAMTGMGDTEENLLRLAEALSEIDKDCNVAEGEIMIGQKAPLLQRTIGDAIRAESTECTPNEAIGKIAAEHIWAYPPGIPVVIAGERITEETIAYLRQKQALGVTLHRRTGACTEELYLRVIT